MRRSQTPDAHEIPLVSDRALYSVTKKKTVAINTSKGAMSVIQIFVATKHFFHFLPSHLFLSFVLYMLYFTTSG